MRPPIKRPLLVYFALLFLLLAVLSGTAFRSAPTSAPGDSATPPEIPDLAGTWVGSWEDTTYFVGGALSFDIAVDGTSYTATGSIDMSAFSWAGLGVETGAATGNAPLSTLEFNFLDDDGQIGFGAGTIDGNSATGSGTVTAPLDFGTFTFEGTIQGDVMWGIFDFPGGGEGKAMLWNTTPTDDTSMSAVKSAYGDR